MKSRSARSARKKKDNDSKSRDTGNDSPGLFTVQYRCLRASPSPAIRNFHSCRRGSATATDAGAGAGPDDRVRPWRRDGFLGAPAPAARGRGSSGGYPRSQKNWSWRLRNTSPTAATSSSDLYWRNSRRKRKKKCALKPFMVLGLYWFLRLE